MRDMQNLVFDQATVADTDELVKLRIEYMIDDFGKITEFEKRCMERQLPDFFERKLGKELVVFTARDEGKIVATAYLMMTEKPSSSLLHTGWDSEVLSVYTKPAYRKRGICTQLIENLVEYGRERKLDRILLNATDEGYPVYKKVGFEDRNNRYSGMIMKFR